MDTMMWKILLSILIFADGNIAYFEIRRLIHYLRNHHLHKMTGLSDGSGAAAPGTESVNAKRLGVDNDFQRSPEY